jgi:hypothetical protein
MTNMPERQSPREPTLRDAAILTIVGYVMTLGVAFASLRIMPALYVSDDAARTAHNIAASPKAFAVVIFIYLVNFIGDIVAAWGLYLLLRPVNASISMFVSALRAVFATAGLAATLNLVTAYRLLTRPAALAAFGQAQINAQVQLAIASFNSQFAFLTVFFGMYLVLQGWLIFRAPYFPKWLGIAVALDGVVLVAMNGGPYFWPSVNLGFLFVVTFAELLLPLWLVISARRLPEAASALE